jgi:hypothetical protein
MRIISSYLNEIDSLVMVFDGISFDTFDDILK